MKKQTKLSCLQIPGLALALGITFVAATATATPYATCLTNNGGVISFRLNEAADNVKIIHNGGATTNDLGALPKGLTTTANLGVAGVYSVQVTKNGGAGYLGYLFGTTNKISDDTTRENWFYLPTGVAVNNNPSSPHFGRVFVANAMAGTTTAPGSRPTGDGLYLLNADQSDAVGQGDAARVPSSLVFNVAPTGTSTYNRRTPWHLEVSTNDILYIADWSTNRGGIWCADMDAVNGYGIFEPLFGLTNNTVHTTCNGSVIVQGSTNSGDLQIWAFDGRWPGSGQRNRILRWDIGSGPLPWNTPPNAVGGSMYTSVDDVQSDLDRGPDGKFYGVCYRDAGTDVSSFKVFDTDATTELFASLSAWGSPDPVRQIYCCKLTPDGRRIALYNIFGRTIFLALTNGIPDRSTLTTLDTFANSTASNGKDLSFDIVGNLYVVDNITELLRVYTPGGGSVATTGSDGNFSFERSAPEVSLETTASPASEDGTPGQFTLTRSQGADGFGNTNATLTVDYTISGTASNGVDYTTLSGSVTFAVGATTTTISVTPLPDALAEPTEAVTLTLTPKDNYIPTTARATVLIACTNTPVFSVNSASPSMYERVENDYARVVVGRDLGNTNTTFWLFPENFTFGGTAVMNVDYVVNSNLFPHNVLYGDRTAVLRLVSPLNDSLLKGDRTIIIGMAPAAEFNVATNTVTTTIVDDENPAETILWSDNFNTDSSANYAVCLASLAGNDSYTIEFAMDYAGYGIPAAPHSSSDTLGLRLNLNKDYINGASGMNLYPTNVNFGTNFALRFDMFLFCGNAATSEHSTFGINHSGNKTNWFRASNYGYTNWTDYDGLFAAIQADGSGGTVAGDFMLYTAPRRTNSNIVLPTSRAIRNASTLTEVFKNPPYSSMGGSVGGVPANLAYPMDPQARTWADVELSQIIKFGQPVITLRVNHTVIYQYTNTQASSLIATNGTIMLGYCDAYDSATGDSWGVIYDNARVVSLDPLRIVTQPVGATVSLGGSTTLSVVTAGSVSGLTTYQWRLYGTNLPGATSASLPLNNVQFANYGNYTVVVSDGVISITSSAALVAPPAPLIITPPASRAAVLGGTAAFTVTAATYSGVTNYQWRFNGADLTGQTGSSLALANVQAGNFGAYTVRVSDGITAVTSAPNAVLSQALPPSIASTFNGSSFGLQFPSEPGVTYYVEWKGELTNGAWNPLSTNAGTGNPITITDTPLTPPQRFYRVRVQ